MSEPIEFERIRIEPAYRKVAAALLDRITTRSIASGASIPWPCTYITVPVWKKPK